MRPPARLRRTFGPLFQNEVVLIVCVSTTLVMLGQGIVGPILPLFAKSFDVSTAAVGLTLSAFAIARMIFNIPSGLLADRWGRRILLVGGPLVAGAGNLLSGTAPDFTLLLVWRFLAGVGSAMYMTGAIIVITDIATDANRGRLMALNQSALLLGVTLGPAVGGVVAELAGLRAPFYVVGVATLAAAVWNLARVPETRPASRPEPAATSPSAPPAGGGGPRLGAFAMLLSLNFALIGVVNLAVFFARSGRQTLLPLFGEGEVGLSAGVIGAVFALMAFINFALTFPAGSLIDRFGARATILPSALLSLVGYALFLPAGSLTAYVFASVVLGVGSGILGPAPAAYAAEIAPPERRGAVMGIFRTVGDVGFVVGPPLVGLIVDVAGFGPALLANGAMLVATALAFALFASGRRIDPSLVPGAEPAASRGRAG